MRWLVSWLGREARWWQIPFLIICFIAVALTCTIIVSKDVYFQGTNDGAEGGGLYYLFYWVLYDVGLQEIIFRAFPLAFAVFLFGKSRWALFAALVSSVLFVYAHIAYAYQPNVITSFATYGIGGLTLSLIYLKCGGFNKNLLKQLKALLICVVAHSLWNMLVDFLASLKLG